MTVPVAPYFHKHLLVSVFLMLHILIDVWQYLTLVLTCIFLITNNVERLFYVLIWHPCIFFGEESAQVFCTFFIKFSYCWILIVLYIILCWIMLCKYFLHLCLVFLFSFTVIIYSFSVNFTRLWQKWYLMKCFLRPCSIHHNILTL